MNYQLIASKPKAKIIKEYDKIPKVKEVILNILNDDLKIWNAKGLKQPGIEKNILKTKILKQIKVNSEIIDISLTELLVDQKIVNILDSYERFIIFPIIY